MALRRVVAAVYPDFQLLAATGPLEVFPMATRLLANRGPAGYVTELVSRRGGPVRSSSGVVVETGPLVRVRGPIDTLLVVGGLGLGDALGDSTLVRWTGGAARRARRTVSVCTGAFLLAEAGLLDGRRVTTHWSACESLGRRYPAVEVDPEPIFVHHGDLATSAGVTAGMDLALALVEDDHGSALALEVARWLVLFLKRPGGQAQFSAHLTNQTATRPALAELQVWLADHVSEDLSVAAMARRVAMSVRSFARAFRAEVGETPGSYVEGLRVEAARRWLEDTERPIRDVARVCGFGSVETMYRVFHRTLEVSPREYRRRFASSRGATA
jgi:transcriptional regulator GlxA family with amidase domain